MKTAPLLREKVARLVARTIRKQEGGSHADFHINFSHWQWHQGVALFGLLRAGEVLPDSESTAFVRAWVDAKLATGTRPKSINTTAPLLAISELYKTDRNEGYREVCEEYADWCMRFAPRLSDGTFEHSCVENSYKLQVWADTLFMGCLFLARWGVQTGNARLVSESLWQFRRHYELLADPATGLLFHGYNEQTQKHLGVLWGRGNGWFAIASVELLELMDPGSSGRIEIEQNLRTVLAGLLKLPRSEGTWHTVLNDSTTPLEMSCTAAFAYTFDWARRQPWGTAQHAECAEAAFLAACSAINQDGELIGASGGTPIMADSAQYAKIAPAVTAFSQGIALYTLASALRAHEVKM